MGMKTRPNSAACVTSPTDTTTRSGTGSETLSPAGMLSRVRAHYHEMPGLSLTLSEAVRLFGFDATTCDKLLDACVRGGILAHRDGRFVLA